MIPSCWTRIFTLGSIVCSTCIVAGVPCSITSLLSSLACFLIPTVIHPLLTVVEGGRTNQPVLFGTLLVAIYPWGTPLYELWQSEGDNMMVEFVVECDGVPTTTDTDSGITPVSLLFCRAAFEKEGMEQKVENVRGQYS